MKDSQYSLVFSLDSRIKKSLRIDVKEGFGCNIAKVLLELFSRQIK